MVLIVINFFKVNSRFNEDLNNLEQFLESIKKSSIYDENIKEKFMKTNVLEFFDPQYKLESFLSQNKDLHKNTNRKPIEYVLSVISKINNNNEEYRILYKKGDDLRKDFYIMQSLELIKKVSIN